MSRFAFCVFLYGSSMPVTFLSIIFSFVIFLRKSRQWKIHCSIVLHLLASGGLGYFPLSLESTILASLRHSQLFPRDLGEENLIQIVIDPL